jgi:hypothetical protein
MRLIWTYDSKGFLHDSHKDRRTILLNYYMHSIETAKKFGYYTIMYCDLVHMDLFKNLVDEIHILENYENSPLWDSFKFKALEDQEDDNYCLIDGDVILHAKLPELDTDVIFDSWEVLNWKREYKNTIDKLTKLNIADHIKEWNYKQIPIMCCGILNIKTKINRLIYINNWKVFNNFVKENIEQIDTDYATAVGAQYLLTLITKYNNFTYKNLCEQFGENGNYYKHHAGIIKYKAPIVPTDRLIGKMQKKDIF